MALEDVVQGVNVKVSTDGVDDAKQQLAGLEKAIESLAKQASGAATPGAGGSGGGIPDLTKAFGDLNATGAQAFAQIARSASSGDITGLATLLGGRLAGSVAEAGKALFDFTEQQTQAGIRNASMAKEFGTTPAVMQGLKSSFEEAGVSGQGFERLVNRLSRQVSTDYPDMMRNVQESNLRAQKSALGLEEAQRAVVKSFTGNEPERATMRLAEAQEKLQESYGVPKEAFDAQDKLREQRKLQLDQMDAIEAVDDAYNKEQTKRKQAQIDLASKQEEQRKQELNDIPHIAQMLQNGMDVSEVSVKKLREGIEYLVNPSGQASPVDVLAKEMDLIKTGAIGSSQAIELMQQSMGRTGSSGGVGGLDAASIVSQAQRTGGDIVRNAEQGESVVGKLNIGQSPTDTSNFKAFAAQVEEAASIWGALMQKLGSFAAASATPFVKKLAEVGEAIADISEGKYSSGLHKLLYTSAENRPHFAIDDAEKEAQASAGGPSGGAPTTGAATGRVDSSGGYTNSDGVYVPGPPSNAPRSALPPPRSPGYDYALGPVGAPAGTPTSLGTPTSIGTPVPVGSATDQIRSGGAEVGGALNEVAAIIRAAATGITTNTAPPPHWGGGPIRVPGYSSGGRVSARFRSNIPSFADGGLLDNLAMPKSGKSVPGGDLSKQLQSEHNKIGSTLADVTGITNARKALSGEMTEQESKEYFISSLLSFGEPELGEGALKAVSSLAMSSAKDVAAYPEWRKGMIGFADGGSVEDAISKQQEAVADAELDAQQHPSKQSRNQLAYQKMLLAKLMAKQGASQRTQQADDRQKQATDRANQEQEKRQSEANAQRRHMSADLVKLGGTPLGDLQFADGGYLPGFAQGSVRGPGTGTSDSIMARLSNGEFVMKDAAVRTYGEGFMHAINNMTLPPMKYESGGMVPYSSLPRFAEGGMERPGSILNLHVGGEVFSGLKAPAAVADQLRKFAIGQQTSSTGRKPSWAGE